MYATERQTSDAHHRLMPPTVGVGACVQLYCERLDLTRIVRKRHLDCFNGLFRTSIIVLLENVSACFV